jgi:hypothetical protein
MEEEVLEYFNIPSVYSHFSSGSHLATRSDFAGVQTAQRRWHIKWSEAQR